MNEIGKQVKAWREKRGMTQEELAQAAGIRKEQVSYLERGAIQDPRFFTVTRLADALGIKVDELRGQDEDEPVAAAAHAEESAA